MAIERKSDTMNFKQLFDIQKQEVQDVIAAHKHETQYQFNKLEERFSDNRRSKDDQLSRVESELHSIRQAARLTETQDKDRMLEWAKFNEEMARVKSDTTSNMSEVRTEMLHLKGTLDFFVENKADQASLIELKDAVLRKIDQEYMDQTIQQSQNEITSLIINLKEEVRSRFSGIDNTLFERMDSKASLADIENIMDTKVDSKNLGKHLEGFVTAVDFNRLREDLTQLRSGSV